MSKPATNLVLGTSGALKLELINPKVQYEMVKTWAEIQVKELQAISNRQRNMFNTACIVVDEKNNKVYFGRNGGIDKDNAFHNEILFGPKGTIGKGLIPAKSLNQYPTPYNCAESHAINKALNNGANISDLHIYVISTSQYDFGKPKPCCKNCTVAYKGKIKKNNSGWSE